MNSLYSLDLVACVERVEGTGDIERTSGLKWTYYNLVQSASPAETNGGVELLTKRFSSCRLPGNKPICGTPHYSGISHCGTPAEPGFAHILQVL